MAGVLVLAGCGEDDEDTTSTVATPISASTSATSTASGPQAAPTPGPASTTPSSTGAEPTATSPAVQGPGAHEGVSTSAPRPVLLAAQAAWVKAKQRGVDLSTGPCIANPLAGFRDWVVDVSHTPRTAVDDDPANQCARYASGQAHHFVELTPKGNLIRAR